jgi:cation diffusion facilitator family transporter
VHIHKLERWQHGHDFAVIEEHGERRTIQVLALTAITMVVEIVAGLTFGSMALLADGWHMGTHVAAFSITIFAYRYAKRHANSTRFSFGTGKVSVLGGFASAVALVVVALVMALESVHRLVSPEEIQFNQAIGVAFLGLMVNVFSAFLLRAHGHHHEADKHNHHHDHNLKAAYLHVLADALTSLLAIAALSFGKFFGWHWLDPVMGIVGACVISKWAHGLLKDTGSVLLDESLDDDTIKEIKQTLESHEDNRVVDIHVWKVGPGHYATIVSLVTHFPKDPEHYKKLLSGFDDLSHITVEVNQCHEPPCITPDTTPT